MKLHSKPQTAQPLFSWTSQFLHFLSPLLWKRTFRTSVAQRTAKNDEGNSRHRSPTEEKENLPLVSPFLIHQRTTWGKGLAIFMSVLQLANAISLAVSKAHNLF